MLALGPSAKVGYPLRLGRLRPQARPSEGLTFFPQSRNERAQLFLRCDPSRLQAGLTRPKPRSSPKSGHLRPPTGAHVSGTRTGTAAFRRHENPLYIKRPARVERCFRTRQRL
jgi:hypothetical protein